MTQRTWPVEDRPWVARYQMSMAGKHVPADALAERERELLDAVHEAGLSAVELFGDAGALALDDAAELATVDEAVRTSEGGGLRPALREVGGTLMGIAVVAVVMVAVRSGWRIDVDAGAVLIAVSVAVVFVGWVVGRAFYSAGRPVLTVGLLISVGAAAVAGIATGASLGPGHVAARNVPLPLLGVVLLAPGVLALVVASRMPQQSLRQVWNDADWLRRFQGGLRTRLVPAATARGHVVEIEQAIAAGTASAFAEFGHPLVLAREIADADRTARARRWWVSTVAGTSAPLVIAALILASDSWAALTIPLAVLLVLSGLMTPLVRWGDRPGRRGR